MPEPINYNFEVRVVIFQENGIWIAQGLEWDITGHGKTTDAALENFGHTLLGQAIVDIHHGEIPLAKTPEAPQFCFRRWEEAEYQGKQPKSFVTPKETPDAFIISALAADTRLAA